MMHESGTGGAPQYGVVCQLPYTDETLAGDQELSLSRTKKDSATIGRYFVNTPNIDIEFTSGERSGLFKYNFHSGDKANVLVNASHHLSAPKRPQWTQHFVKGSIKTKTTMDILVKLPLKVVGVINLIGQFTSVVNLMLILLKLPVLLMEKFLTTPTKPIQAKLMIQWG